MIINKMIRKVLKHPILFVFNFLIPLNKISVQAGDGSSACICGKGTVLLLVFAVLA